MAINRRDRDIIEKISQYCIEIGDAHTTFQKSYDAFVTKSVYRNAVCLCLMQIGELANHLSDEFKDSYKQIPWKAIRGMRNVVAHEYGHIDTVTVWETAENGVEDLLEFCEQILGNC